MTDPAGEVRREAMALRGEFVRAFVEHVGPRPASERLMIRLPVLLIVTALVAGGSVVVGVFMHLIGGSKATGVPGVSSSSQVTFHAVAGWDCAAGNDSGFDPQGRTAAWRTVLSGGWREDGCHGTFESFPMSGSATTDDPTQYAEWWFTPSSGNMCAVSVFVPGVPDGVPDAAATAAHYAVTSAQGGAPYAEFALDQTANRGQWVTVGAYPLKDRTLVVRGTNRGKPARPGDRIAISQVRVDCAES